MGSPTAIRAMAGIRPESFALLALACATFLIASGADAAPISESTSLGELQAQGDALGEAMHARSSAERPVDPNASKDKLKAREKEVKAKLKKLAQNPAFKEAGVDPQTASMATLKKKENEVKDKIKALHAKKTGGANSTEPKVAQAEADEADANQKKADIEKKEKAGAISKKEAQEEKKVVQTDIAKAKVKKAQVLRKEARAELRKEGKPIPASLAKGALAKKVAEKMPEAAPTKGAETAEDGPTNSKVQQAEHEAKDAAKEEEEVKDLVKKGTLSKEEGDSKLKKAKTHMAKAKVKKAQVLRKAARAELRKEGKPIPARLQKGVLSARVEGEMPEAEPTASKVEQAEKNARNAEAEKNAIKQKLSQGKISKEEADAEMNAAKTHVAQAKVSKAQALRHKAREFLRKQGKPIPDKLKKGGLSQKVAKKMPEAAPEGSLQTKQSEEKSVKAKIKQLPGSMQKASIPELQVQENEKKQKLKVKAQEHTATGGTSAENSATAGDAVKKVDEQMLAVEEKQEKVKLATNAAKSAQPDQQAEMDISLEKARHELTAAKKKLTAEALTSSAPESVPKSTARSEEAN